MALAPQQPHTAVATVTATAPVTGSQTNSGGGPIFATVATANQPISNSGLGSVGFDLLHVEIEAETDGGSVVEARLVLVQGASEAFYIIAASGAVETLGEIMTDPSGDPWTGTLLDSLTLRVEMDVTIPAGQTASITLESASLSASLSAFAASGLAGDDAGQGDAGESTWGGLAGDDSGTGAAGEIEAAGVAS